MSKRGDDIKDAMTALAQAMQRAQVLSSESCWRKYRMLDADLRAYYEDTDEAFHARIKGRSKAVAAKGGAVGE